MNDDTTSSRVVVEVQTGGVADAAAHEEHDYDSKRQHHQQQQQQQQWSELGCDCRCMTVVDSGEFSISVQLPTVSTGFQSLCTFFLY